MAATLGRSLALAAAVAIAPMGCTSFTMVRSAQVTPSSSITAQASIASPPGDPAGWMSSLDCASNCSHAIIGGDLAWAYGHVTPGAHPYTLGVGVNGLAPYVEGYMQLDRSPRRPYGVGARLGVPLNGARSAQFYGRLDVPLTSGMRLLWNPGVVYQAEDGLNASARWVGLVQGLGLQLGEQDVFTPSVSVGLGRGVHSKTSSDFVTRAFVTAGLSVTVRNGH